MRNEECHDRFGMGLPMAVCGANNRIAKGAKRDKGEGDKKEELAILIVARSSLVAV